MKCVLLSNINVESIARQMERHEVHLAQGYGAWIQELADPSSETFRFGPSSIFLIVDGAELLRGPRGLAPTLVEIDKDLARIEQAAERRPDIKFFVSTIDVPARALRPIKQDRVERRVEQRWNGSIGRASGSHANIYVFDLKELVEQNGRAFLYSNKRWYLGGLRFSMPGEKLIARELERLLDAQLIARKKCVLFDLDNTLWGGVIGEDGVNGIQLSETGEGARYRDFQLRIRELGQMGIILGIVSKNNEADVCDAFNRHEHMVLRMSDFAAMKVNWLPKPQNIAEITKALDISMDTIVFIDDNPVEREAVRTALPEVAVPEFPSDTCELGSFFERVYKDYFFTLETNDEDRNRTDAYLANAKRTAERTAATSIDEFLTGLGTKIFFTRVHHEDLARAAQLTQKTNQFNLTTRRYTEHELRALQSRPDAKVFIASVVDKYGDSGKVFVSIVRMDGRETAHLDTFLMSCRVLGRFIEDQLLDQLVSELRADGLSRLRVQFIPTKKNAPARGFIERLRGGRLLSTDKSGAQTWEFDIAKASPVTKPAYAALLTQAPRFSETLP